MAMNWINAAIGARRGFTRDYSKQLRQHLRRMEFAAIELMQARQEALAIGVFMIATFDINDCGGLYMTDEEWEGMK